jgi:hypothetical protein
MMVDKEYLDGLYKAIDVIKSLQWETSGIPTTTDQIVSVVRPKKIRK